jgi:hypothetical protein
MKTKKRRAPKTVLKERLAVWDRLAEMSAQMVILVKNYCEGGLLAAEAEAATRSMRRELNQIEHAVICWRLQREGRN